ncbi:MAG: hypothetical protein JOZ69_20325 [Myxococcales bacterium]|nr:hypothetical protein [Myxococcales bacterium]
MALAKVLREGANLLLFDEPTNDLDLPTLAALEEMLLDYEGSVIVVTHDRAFLDRVATGILAFEAFEGNAAGDPPARVTRYGGGYQDYVSQREYARAAAQTAPATSTAASASAGATTPPAATKGRAKSGLTYAERLELEGIVVEIDAAERRAAEVEALLADPSLYAKRGHEVAGLRARLEAERERVRALTSRWELLEEKKAGAAGGA